MTEYVITFASSHQAIKANTRLHSFVEIIPTPRQISSECGFSLLTKKWDLPELKENLSKQQLQYAKIYIVKKDMEGNINYEENS
jgi:hypothetical protein